ncbi:flagellar assembly peptidoglycan hydrolase FlgJ [Shewanella dokdonensis]|uniref:Peptidoglycan hydrolase FlgJ n=1 Tax=Shewanella dokdonensis TaxID=712036 RepID=A0ABX8DG65_9GAMM|nr:flagellar assembly peptidoglycan hydrolase FlgJ [Shewanella dokdonensis]MCL1073952.1 flagellar assembly peptidoglycan hydrolase FlgJ [Shewanella dokdonensis]QVK23717.1 flagellar assembly peptidoglycan hydrolase FlgJ [Shewanella dokdonensis]
MDQLSNSSQFLDIAGLDNLRAKAQKDQKSALKEVARQFESIFVQMLMKSMREANAAFEADNPLNSQYTKFYEQMHDQQMSVDLSKKGMLGLADLMVQQLDPQDSGITPSSVLRNTQDQPAMLSAKVGEPAQVAATKAASTEASLHFSYRPKAVSLAHADRPRTSVSDSRANLRESEGLSPTKSGVLDYDTLDSILTGKALPQDKHGDIRSQEDFVKVLYPYARDAAEKLGTSPEVLLAQSALETGWGQKMVKTTDGRPSNNLFNIKADSRWSGNSTTAATTEYEKGTPVRENAAFRVYGNLRDSFNDYVALISQSERYSKAREVAAEPAQYVRGLAEAGYATDPQYASKVMKVLQSIKSDFGQFLQGDGGQ